MQTINAQGQIPFEFANPNERHFVLDGRRVEFPDGLQTAKFTHTIHRFPGKFVPQVARELLQLVGVGNRSLILDPFCGSGTTLVEGAISGVHTIGVDFDPLAALISRVKTTALSPQNIIEIRNYWAGNIGLSDLGELEESVPNLFHWFKPDIARQLAYIKHKALQIQDESLRLFSLIVFSSIIRRVSNADDQTQKTYVSGTLKKIPPTPSELFPLFLERAIRGMAAYTTAHRAPVTVYNDDARVWRSPKKIDGIITSPPYIDSIDYVYNQMLEYFWLHKELGLVSIDEVKALRKKPVGFRYTDIDSCIEHLATNSPSAYQLLKPILAKIMRVSNKEARNVAGYFEDFAKHLRTIKGSMKRGAIYAIVVGESYIRGVTVPTPRILASLFEANGFENLGWCSYVIKRHYMKFPRRSNSGKIKIDYVYCFKNP